MKQLLIVPKIFIVVILLLTNRCTNEKPADLCAEVAMIDSTKYQITFYADSPSDSVKNIVEPVFNTDARPTKAMVNMAIEGAKTKSNAYTKSTARPSLLFAMAEFPVEGVEPKSVATANLITELFNSSGTECLKGNGTDKIRKFAQGKVPENLSLHSQDAEMLYYEQIPGLLIVSTFRVKRAGSTTDPEPYSLPTTRVGVGSILDLINPGDANSYIYQMDCSGYFSFALSVATGRPNIAELKASGEASSKGQKATIVAYGKFSSPLAIALKPGASFNAEFDNATRKQVLQNILNTPSSPIKDNDIVMVNNYYYLLITSNAGSSGFSGKVQLDGSVRILSASASAGGTYSKAIRYTEYDTYVSKRLDKSPSNETQLTGLQIRNAIKAIPN